MQRRVEMDRLQELVRLHRMGSGDREVARLLGMSPNTERQYRQALDATGLLAGTAEVTPGNYLHGWVLGWGGQAEVESPREARDAFARRVEELAETYRS